MARIDWKLVAVSIGLPFLAALIGNLFTADAITTWYPTLTKPGFTPPNWVFGPVWTLLYLFMGVALYRVLRNGWQNSAVRRATAIFGVQLVLNAAWSAAFFGLRSPIAGVVIITPLWAAIALTIQQFNRIDRTAALLLVPYLAWVTFATLLNAAILFLN